MRDSAMNRSEWKIVSIVGAAHFFSHFFFTSIPLTFPLLREAYSVGYAELGFGYAVFSAATLLLQTPLGFLVDRYGARWFLVAGVIIEAIALLLLGVFETYGAFLWLMGIAGIANAVYHPCDYSILTKCIRSARLGRAFSIHTFCGQSGAITGPVILVMVSFGIHWSNGFMICGAVGLVIALALVTNLGTLSVATSELGNTKIGVSSSRSSLLLSAPVILGWLFFLGFSMSSVGIYDFGVASFIEIYAVDIATAGVIIWIFLVADAVGILTAGIFAHRWKRQELVVINSFLAITACMFFIVIVPMPLFALAIPLGVAGFFWGFIAPSRDIIISSVAPQQDMGKVFGLVTTGFNAGGIIGPPMFGYLLDSGDPYAIFWGAGVISILSILTMFKTSKMQTAAVKQSN